MIQVDTGIYRSYRCLGTGDTGNFGNTSGTDNIGV